MSMKRENTGSGFLFQSRQDEEIFTPEQFTPEQLAFHEAVAAFVEKEVVPRRADIDKKTKGLLPGILKGIGQLGALGLDIPEEFGGTAQPKVTSMLVAEGAAVEASWTVTFGAHTGIGTLPIVFFGNEEQKKKYLPKLATGEWVAAYALTEAGSGSDALAARSTAKLSDDGKYWILNGQKQWITNAGFADVFVAFAKIDGERFSAFIVERGFPGVSVGPEENKLGIRGSSTCTLILEDAQVPVENLLGDPGKGHKIAFNILNVGRLKLGVFAVGGVKQVLREALDYARTRKQFNKALIEFSLIRDKLASVLVDLYAAESMGYRAAGGIDENAASTGKGMESLEEFAVESSILKVWGSELAFRAADEALQILGGYGFMEDFPVAKLYRDVRINRIFEGTNEVNRMLVPGVLLKRAMKGQIPLMDEFNALNPDEHHLPPLPDEQLERATRQAQILSIVLMGKSAMTHMQGLEDQQEILLALADICGSAYALDSVRRRYRQADRKDQQEALAHAFAIIETDRVIARASRLALDLGGETLRNQLLPVLQPLTASRTQAIGKVNALMLEHNGYWLGGRPRRG